MKIINSFVEETMGEDNRGTNYLFRKDPFFYIAWVTGYNHCDLSIKFAVENGFVHKYANEEDAKTVWNRIKTKGNSFGIHMDWFSDPIKSIIIEKI